MRDIKTLDIHVGGSFVDTKRRVLAAVERARTGQDVGEDHITFASWDALASVMTTKRFELLRHLHRHPEASVATLAQNLNRDGKSVLDDVEALCDAGLIERSDSGLRADYDEIRTRMAL